MIFYPYAFIPLCRFNKLNPNLRLSYCTNEGLRKAIELIGENRGEISKKSLYKRGINYLSQNLQVDNKKVSKSEIKRLVRPNCRRLHLLVLPMRSVQILEGIVQYVDCPENGCAHMQCRECNHSYLDEKHARTFICYNYLIDDLLRQLNLILGNLNPNAVFMKIAQDLVANAKLCE